MRRQAYLHIWLDATKHVQFAHFRHVVVDSQQFNSITNNIYWIGTDWNGNGRKFNDIWKLHKNRNDRRMLLGMLTSNRYPNKLKRDLIIIFFLSYNISSMRQASKVYIKSKPALILMVSSLFLIYITSISKSISNTPKALSSDKFKFLMAQIVHTTAPKLQPYFQRTSVNIRRSSSFSLTLASQWYWEWRRDLRIRYRLA